jgi:hypothetical protein
MAALYPMGRPGSYTTPGDTIRAVIAALDELARTYGYPKYLRIDNELRDFVKLKIAR